MPYIITKSNGTTLTTVADGSIDNSTSLTFVGKNYAGYGGILDQNLFYLLENFSKSSSPLSPVQGQLWFDSKNLKLNAYDGTSFKSLPFTSLSTTQPNNLTSGDFWFNPTTNQLSINYLGSFYNLNSSVAGANNGSGLLLSTVKDSSNVSHLILKATINTSTVFVVSSDPAFSVNFTDSLYSSFSYITPGINLFGADSTNSGSTSDTSNFYFYGTASDALQSDGLATLINGGTQTVYYSASTSSQANYIVARDSNSNIYAQNFFGIASSANTLLVNGSIYNSASTLGSPNTVASRDNSGNLYANNFIGTSSYASIAGSLLNSITFNSSGSGVSPGTAVTGSTPQVVSYNSVGALSASSFTGSNQNLTTTSGWQKMPGGMVIAWGFQLVSSYPNEGTYGQGHIPISFGGAPFTVSPASVTATLSIGTYDTAADWWTQIVSSTVTRTGCSVYIQSSGSAGNYYTGFYWMAIGY